jgi:hypothetical protein
MRQVVFRGLRVTVAFHVTDTAVVIDRLLYGGRDLEGLLWEEDEDG